MMYTADEVFDFVQQEDVKFIRLAFCDVYGRQKNISIQPSELMRAFDTGISIDASAIDGFGDEANSDLLLFPDPKTLSPLPWRPSRGKVVRMYCDIHRPDGSPFEKDTRRILKKAVQYAKERDIAVQFGAEFEFYLFKTDEDGNSTKIPFDNAGYMDVAPEDRGENIRREICLTMLEMGICPESSHHEEGPGQNEIDFKYGDALSSADNAMNFISACKAVANGNGLYADFSPKPLDGESGNGLHINMSVNCGDKGDCTDKFMAGVLAHIGEITAVLNPTENSYARLGEMKAPKYITWSHENRSQLIRIPAAAGQYSRIELRSPDPTANPYLAFALLIYAGVDGIEKGMTPPEEVKLNLYKAPQEALSKLKTLPLSLSAAKAAAEESELVKKALGMSFTEFFGIM